MKTYETFARDLDRLLGGEQAVRITVPGYVPLTIAAIGRSADGGTLIALSHTAIQNGDLMRDPEIVFEVRASSELLSPGAVRCTANRRESARTPRRPSSPADRHDRGRDEPPRHRLG